jgi:hypothetical protein
VNGIHALRRLDIRNLSPDHSITIKLRSNLASQIAWQLENENLARTEGIDGGLSSMNSSSSSLNSIEERQTPYPQQFNQLFNHVGHVDYVVIEPRQVVKVILAFLPDEKRRSSTPSSSVRGGQEGADVFVVSNENSRDSSFDFYDVKGLLFFFGYKTTELRSLSAPDLRGIW